MHTNGPAGIVDGVRNNVESPGKAMAVGAARTGIEELFRREYEPMYRLAFAMLGSDGDAEDVAQEAFAAVAARWDVLDNPGGYLRVSVVNGGRKRMRSRARRTNAEVRMKRDAATNAPVAQREYLLDALDGLSERQRVAVVLTYYSGLDSIEVGELMECRPATVRSLVRHALTSLRKVVEK